MEKKTVVDQIEIKRDGTILIRMTFEVWDGEEQIAKAYHRFVLPVGFDAAAQIAYVNQHVESMGKAPITERDAKRINRLAGHVWTAKVRAFADVAQQTEKRDAIVKEAADREQMVSGLPDTKAEEERANIARLREAADKLTKQIDKAAAKANSMKDEDD